MKEKTDLWLEEHLQEMLKDLKGCLRIPSVKEAPSEGAPFGAGIKACLDYTLSLADKMGFETIDGEGYYGCIDYGQGEEMLGILAHLDVVPEGTGWSYEPYGAQTVDGKIYARGAIDDKGPALAALYALAAVRASGLPLKRRVRVILGCDEESGMDCMVRYKEVEEVPTLSLSPDGQYPLTNSEKTIVRAVFKRTFPSSVTASAGQVANIVPGEAQATVPLAIGEVRSAVAHFEEKNPCRVALKELDSGSTRIHIKGRFAHASTPEEGANAIQGLFNFLALLPLGKEEMSVILPLKEKFRMEHHGESIGLDKADESGRLTLNLGVLRWDEKGLALTFDLRCPTTLSQEGIKKALCLDSFEFRAGYSLSDDAEIVQKLLAVFKERTGLDLQPVKIGGGTYARTLPNAVSFGPDDYLDPSAAHVADEYITEEQLLFTAKILADAILSLAG